MVSPHNYPPLGGRRPGGGRGNGYPPPYPGRRPMASPIYSGIQNPAISEDDNSSQRKRIAVACGRCRKRKIRCSGDSGNGSPCTNCRNAGHEPCQYLRVSSQETRLKQNTFEYNLEASRQYHVRGSANAPSLPVQQQSQLVQPIQQQAQLVQSVQVPPAQPVSQYDTGLTALEDGEGLAYRHSSASFTYHTRPCDPVTPWSNGLPVEQNVSYNGYPPIYEHEISLPYRPGNNNAVASSPRDADVCVGPESSYTYSSSHTTNLAHHTAPGKSTHQNSTAIPFLNQHTLTHDDTPTDASTTGAFAKGPKRTLPLLTSNMGPSSYRPEPFTPINGYDKQPTASSQSPQTPTSGTGTTPATPGSEASSSCYTNYQQPSAGLPSTVPSYAPMMASQLTRSNDLYGPSSNSMYSPGLASSASEPFRGSGSGPSMIYRYTDTTISEDGTPTVGPIMPKLEHRSSTPTEAAALGLTHLHNQHGQQQQDQRLHNRQTFVAQNRGQHTSYTEKGEGECNGSESASTDGERKPVVLHT